MDRHQVADALEEIGLRLEFLGENPFKVRAYLNGARILRAMPGELPDLLARGEVAKARGIGKALSDKIETLAAGRPLPLLEDLRAKIPPGLLEWTRVPGLGPRKIQAIHEALGITTLGELEYACRENRLRDLPGFGPATQGKILEGIAAARRREGRWLIPPAEAEARALLASVRAEVAGALRRACEVVDRIDLVAPAADPRPVLDAFAKAPAVREVRERTPASAAAVLASGIEARLLVAPPAAFGAAFIEATGSAEHVAALRARAGGDLPAAPTEEAVYAALGLPWIPPELREGAGEIEDAAAGRLPALVRAEDLRGILHVHSSWSDGHGTIAEMAEGARALGATYLAVCDHSRTAAYAGGLPVERIRAQHAEIDALNASWAGAFRVLKGIECDILPDGTLDYPDEVLAAFELVVASVHSRFRLSGEEQTARVLRALESPYVDILAHPTGRLLLAREPYAIDLERVVRAAAERGVAVEVNAHPHRLDLGWRELRAALAHGAHTSIDPDAHSVAELSSVPYGLGVARKAGCPADRVLNALPLPALLDRLAARRREARG